MFNNLLGADFSNCRNYRYSLWRIWNRSLPLCMIIGLNPSTANEKDNDPTIKSVARVCKNNGYGGFYMMNCFPFVSTDPSKVKENYLTEEGKKQTLSENIYKIELVRIECSDTVFAWGNFDIVKELGIDKMFTEMFPNALVFGKNKNGSPKHPLYCKSETKFVKYVR